MAHDPDVDIFEVGGVPIAAIDMSGLVASVDRYLAGGPAAAGAFVAFCGAHGVVESQKNPRVRQAHRDAWLTVADGRPLFWIGRLLGFRAIRQVPGIESVEAVCRGGVEAGWKHYFLGGGEGVAERLAAEMSRRVPGLAVAGFETPPFRALDVAEVEAMRERIRAAGTQVLWVGLGAPKQELFLADHVPHLPGIIGMGVGAAFDVNIGRLRRAPRAFQVLGLEWAYRLVLEPRRLWWRYSEVVPKFLGLTAKTLVSALMAARRPVTAQLGPAGKVGGRDRPGALPHR